VRSQSLALLDSGNATLLRITPERKVLKYLDIGPAGTYLLADKRILISQTRHAVSGKREVQPALVCPARRERSRAGC
jgi:hypothetical protein